MTYIPAANRYQRIPYRRVGRSGLLLPALSLGLWHNFGDATPIDTQRALLRTAFDLGSPTSTWPTTTARPTAAPRATSAACCRKTSRPTAMN